MSTLNTCDWCLACGESDENGIVVKTIRHYEDCQMPKTKRRFYRHVEHGKKCENCESYGGEDSKLLTCSGCLTTFYCSKECQKIDWKKHKTHCKK
jgi:hypothetical protein